MIVRKFISVMLFIFLLSSAMLPLMTFSEINSDDFSPPKTIEIPLTINLAGFDNLNGNLEQLTHGLISNSSYTYESGKQYKTRTFYFGKKPLQINMKYNYSINFLPASTWKQLQNNLTSFSVAKTVYSPDYLKSYSGLGIPITKTVNLLSNMVKSEKTLYQLVIFNPTISPLNTTTHWYFGNRFRTTSMGSNFDMRVGWSITNNSVFLDVRAKSWWIEQNSPEETQLLETASQGNITSLQKIINKLVSYLIGNVPLSRVPIIPSNREMQLSLISISNSSMFFGGSYYVSDFSNVIKKTKELFPYYNIKSKYYGNVPLKDYILTKNVFDQNIKDLNGTRFLDMNSKVIIALYGLIQYSILSDKDRAVFNVIIVLFNLDVPVYRLVNNNSLEEPLGYSSGMVFVDYYRIRHNSLYSDNEAHYSILHQIPMIFGLEPHTKNSRLSDFVQDPLSSYDMDKSFYLSYSNFSKCAIARYYSILYNVSILYGLKRSYEDLKTYKIINIDLRNVEASLSEANKLFRNGEIISATIKYFDTWDEYVKIREKIVNFIIGIKASYFWVSVILVNLGIIIILRDKKVSEWISKNIQKIILKGKSLEAKKND